SEPHLWQGIDDSGETDDSDVGYRLTVTLAIWDGEEIIDTVSDKVGFRNYYLDKDTETYTRSITNKPAKRNGQGIS
ncbi:MAG: hypothetical protein IKG55_04825, partial [Solobacterium sp.]|nr:hypothetical protein [Solobacterium sp.]